MTQKQSVYVDVITSVVLLAAGLFFFAAMDKYVDEGLPAQISPLVFPRFVTVITLLGALALLVESVRELRAMRAGRMDTDALAEPLLEADLEEAEESSKGFYLYIAILVAYYFAFDILGFLLTTPLVMLAVSRLLGGRRILVSLLLFIAFTLVVDQTFFRVLKMALPEGILAS